MFSKALSQVEQYTWPVVFSARFWDGRVGSGCGACIFLNSDGWILTAGHIALEIVRKNRQQPEVETYLRERESIENNRSLHPKDKHKRLRALKPNPQWVTDSAVMWGRGLQSRISTYHVDELADLAIGRLQPFDPSWIKNYPVFKNPAEPMLPATSLCRLGFPFHQINATFDERAKTFHLVPGVLPIPRFPNEGIHTRVPILVSPDGKRQAKFIETSSPGLRGQSGGPIFDCNGHVWAMQSKTQSLLLGIAPEIQQGGQKIVEHQFIHVGWGTHVEEIIRFCNQFGVALTLSS